MKPLRRIVLALVLLAFWAPMLTAQNLKGKVTDENTRQPLAFVNVVVNDGLTGTMTDIDGKYEITTTEPIQKLKFSCIGYETKVVDILPDARKCLVALRPTTIELQEVTVNAGENPAHRIIDSLMAHRKANNPNSLESYRYIIYDKMVFTVDSSDFSQAMSQTNGRNNLQMFDSILKKSDLMVMETASEVLFKAPDHKLQNVLGTKVAGMKNPTYIYLVNSMQSISFYDESINITGTDYVNPISRNSKRHYFFTLESVDPIGNGDSLYVISFHPMRGSTFKGLRGTMTVNSDGWALQSVKAEPNEQDGVYNVTIQQLYQKVGSQWFPKQLNTNLKFPGITADIDGEQFPMVAIGKSYLTLIEVNPDLSQRRFSDLEIVVDPDAAYRDENFWSSHRIDSLTQRTKATYTLVDSITKGTNILERMVGVTDMLMDEGAFPIGPVNIDLGEIIRLSESRGWRFGLGLTTNDRFSRHIRLNGVFGYWTRLRDFDYGGGIKWLINRQKQMEFGLQFNHWSEALGEFFVQEHYALLSENDYKYGYFENVNVRSDRLTASFETRFAQHFKLFLKLSEAEKHYQMPPFNELPATCIATAEIKLRFAYKEKFLSQPNGIRSLGTLYPIVWLSYTHAFPNVFGSQYEYDRIKFEATQNIYTHYIGVSKILLQVGYASASCPIMETFNILGSYVPLGLYAPGSFSTMREDEFFCDRFVALYLSHNFSGMLWKTLSPWFKPQLILATNIGWGDIRDKEGLNEARLKTMNKGYFESGIVVKGLLNVMWANVGAGVFYRYGPYAFDNVWDNFAFKLSVSFNL